MTNKSGLKVTRPLYSLRSAQFVKDISVPNADLDEIARNANTLKEMLEKRYLRKYSELKVSENYDKFNKGRGSGKTSVRHSSKKLIKS